MMMVSALGIVIGGLVGTGIFLSATSPRRIPQWERLEIRRTFQNGKPSVPPWSSANVGLARIQNVLTQSNQAPWLSDKRVELNLRQAHRAQSLHEFRHQQILQALTGLLLIALWSALRYLSGHQTPLITFVLLSTTGFVAGGWLTQWNLTNDANKRLEQIESELPVVTDLLAFAVSAGEPLVTAIRRVITTCRGELVQELISVNAALATGQSLDRALHELDRDLKSKGVSRLVRTIVMALERGTPLAEVLRAQAHDSRAEAGRMLLVLAGKKETAMMIPVVFLILPVIVTVALYPGLVALNVLHV